MVTTCESGAEPMRTAWASIRGLLPAMVVCEKAVRDVAPNIHTLATAARRRSAEALSWKLLCMMKSFRRIGRATSQGEGWRKGWTPADPPAATTELIRKKPGIPDQIGRASGRERV